MALPPNLVTNRTAKLPGDWQRQPQQRSGRPRHEPGKMNKREARYAEELELRRIAGEIAAWAFESVKLKVASKPEGTKMKGSWWCPDFMVVMPDGSIEFHEVKGHAEGDWIEKWKVCVEKYPMFRFVLVDK